ncbi:endoglucanase [Xylariomycetidae sp. FL2044]|nr:endoglucanase [Xylariomycetidae sp. FL2044]
MQFSHALLAAFAASSALGHIHILDPVPIRAKENPYSGSVIDYDINNPLSSLSQIPCKGALQYLDAEAGTPVATYARGGTYQMVMGTGATHDGGSCQISLSYDKGATFTVIKSIIGGCAAENGVWDFTVPADAPTGKAVFSWSWINRIGNREFYQDCSAVTITSAKKREAEAETTEADADAAAVSFYDRPQIFIAHVGNGWCVSEGYDAFYPAPGPDVENTSTNPGAPYQC